MVSLRCLLELATFFKIYGMELFPSLVELGAASQVFSKIFGQIMSKVEN